MTQQIETAQTLQARGLELMARHRNLVHSVVERQIDVDVLIAWTRGLSDEDWELMIAAERVAVYMSQAERRALATAYADEPQAGRR
jgi:hypothetical protein